jgi:MEDS: MEthanogen/methylotroph, DcmR Sensory domain
MILLNYACVVILLGHQLTSEHMMHLLNDLCNLLFRKTQGQPPRDRVSHVESCAMETSGFRHQGFMYHGSPSHNIPMMAAVIKERLEQKHRCLYFDSEPMVAGLLSHLTQVGVNVARETAQNSLVVSSHLGHLSEDRTFDVDRMIATLEDYLSETLRDGYVGLWASGDIAWEFGPGADYGPLKQYEMRLEDFMCAHAEMSGICQYHSGVLPPDAMRTGHEMHPSLFINETRSEWNPAYRPSDRVLPVASIEAMVDLYFPHEIRSRASACAANLGMTLDEFIQEAVAEKLNSANKRNLKD